VVSGAGKPLALAFALLGRNFKSVWPVLLLLCGQLSLLAVSWRLTLTCHHLEVDKLGRGRQGRAGASSPSSLDQVATARLEVTE
jgi:hypothetical protein